MVETVEKVVLGDEVKASCKDSQNICIAPTVFWDSSKGPYRKPVTSYSFLKTKKEKKFYKKFMRSNRIAEHQKIDTV